MTPHDLVALARSGTTPLDIAARVFVDASPAAFADRPDEHAQIVGEIARHLGVGTDRIFVTGSAQVGFSLMHGKPFAHGRSDLDFAIVDAALAQRYAGAVRRVTDGLRRVDAFTATHHADQRTPSHKRDAYLSFESDGLIRADLMPDCAERSEFLALFAGLSAAHATRYAEITGLVYASRDAFLRKQAARIGRFVAAAGVAVPATGTDAVPRTLPIAAPALIATDDAAWQRDVLADVRALLRQAETLVDVDCTLVTPLGDGAFDVVVYYRRREDGVADVLDRLFKLRIDAGRRGVTARWVPADRSVATIVHLTAVQAAANQRELGNRAIEASFVVVPDEIRLA
jgi:hypothetical protein